MHGNAGIATILFNCVSFHSITANHLCIQVIITHAMYVFSGPFVALLMHVTLLARYTVPINCVSTLSQTVLI